MNNEGTSQPVSFSSTVINNVPPLGSVVEFPDNSSVRLSIAELDETDFIEAISALDLRTSLESSSFLSSTSSFEKSTESQKKSIKKRKREQKNYPPLLFPTVSSDSFVYGKSLFILQVFQSDVFRGEIHILPVPTSRPNFVQKLGDYCFQSPKKLCHSFGKVN